jgi:hypothetical protein
MKCIFHTKFAMTKILNINNIIEKLKYTNDCSYTKSYHNNILKSLDDSIGYTTIKIDTRRRYITAYTNFDIIGNLHLSELKIFDINKKKYIDNKDIAKTEISVYMKLHRNITEVYFKFIDTVVDSIFFNEDSSDVELVFNILDDDNNIICEVILPIPGKLSIFNPQESSLLVNKIPETLEDKFKRLYE